MGVHDDNTRALLTFFGMPVTYSNRVFEGVELHQFSNYSFFGEGLESLAWSALFAVKISDAIACLLTDITDPAERERILELIEEERQKQLDRRRD